MDYSELWYFFFAQHSGIWRLLSISVHLHAFTMSQNLADMLGDLFSFLFLGEKGSVCLDLERFLYASVRVQLVLHFDNGSRWDSYLDQTWKECTSELKRLGVCAIMHSCAYLPECTLHACEISERFWQLSKVCPKDWFWWWKMRCGSCAWKYKGGDVGSLCVLTVKGKLLCLKQHTFTHSFQTLLHYST